MNGGTLPIIPAKRPFVPPNEENITLRLTAKGVYYWDISLRGNPLDKDIVSRLVEMDASLRAAFPKNVLEAPQEESKPATWRPTGSRGVPNV